MKTLTHRRCRGQTTICNGQSGSADSRSIFASWATADKAVQMDRAAFPAPAEITLNASAQDFDGTVTNVAFYAGANKLGQGASHFRRLEAEPLAEWLKDYTLGELLQKNVIEAGPTHA